MAETISYEVRITPHFTGSISTKREGEIAVVIPALSTTNRNALETLMNAIAAGTAITDVVTAINAL